MSFPPANCCLNSYFPKPDFLVCHKNIPLLVVEAKNDRKKISQALKEAIGVAGEEDHGYIFKTVYWDGKTWEPLSSRGFELTSFPGVSEIEGALLTNNGTTEVTLPEVSEYIDTAIELSSILRSAKIEPSLRPKVLGAIITALYRGEIDLTKGKELASINDLVNSAIMAAEHFETKKKKQLIETLTLTTGDYNRLSGKISKIVFLLHKLNIRSVLQTDTDFLGLLYEAFIRYGYDNNSLGIVFTPRHITKYCAELINVNAKDRVIDIACGSGGFLVASFDRMMRTAKAMGIPAEIVRESIYGFDTNPTVWSLASLNMFFRGDGKSHIENASCFDKRSKKMVIGQFTKALLNPPFSQAEEPERDFILAAMEALQTMGTMAVVVKSGIFADDDNALWRQEFLRKHTVLGLISLPGDLFYPTAIDATIMIAQAHRPQQKEDGIFMAKIWNDGFRKSKGKRVECEGSQLPEVLQAFMKFRNGTPFHCSLATVTPAGECIKERAEFSPECYLPQPELPEKEQKIFCDKITRSILQTAVCIEDIAGEVIGNFPDHSTLPDLPYGTEKTVEELFDVYSGRFMNA